MKAMSNRLSASLKTKLEGANFFQKATGMSVKRCQKDKSRTFDLLKEDKNGQQKWQEKMFFLVTRGFMVKAKFLFEGA